MGNVACDCLHNITTVKRATRTSTAVPMSRKAARLGFAFIKICYLALQQITAKCLPLLASFLAEASAGSGATVLAELGEMRAATVELNVQKAQLLVRGLFSR